MNDIDNILKYTSLITVAGAAISFCIGLIKYLDQRKREEKNKSFELFHDLMRRVSGQGEKPGDTLPVTQQLAAVYELQHFKEYSYASIPILLYLQTRLPDVVGVVPMRAAIQATIDKLK